MLKWATTHWGGTRALALKLSAEAMRDADICTALSSGADSLASLHELHVLISSAAWCYVQPPWLSAVLVGAPAALQLLRVKAPRFGVTLPPGMGNLRHVVLLALKFLGPERGGGGPLGSLQALHALETLHVEGELIENEDTSEVPYASDALIYDQRLHAVARQCSLHGPGSGDAGHARLERVHRSHACLLLHACAMHSCTP
jgi:hypothetical protein